MSVNQHIVQANNFFERETNQQAKMNVYNNRAIANAGRPGMIDRLKITSRTSAPVSEELKEKMQQVYTDFLD
jgi:hypothetical protein